MGFNKRTYNTFRREEGGGGSMSEEKTEGSPEEIVASEALKKMSIDDKTREAVKGLIARNLTAPPKKESVLQKVKEALGIEVEPPKIASESTGNIFSYLIQMKAMDALKGSSDSEDSSMVKLAKELAVVKMMMGSESNPQVQALQQELQIIRQKLEEKEKQEFYNAISNALKEIDERHSKEMEALRKMIEALSSNIGQPPEEQKNPIMQLSDLINILSETIQSLEKIGIKVIKPSEAPPQTLDIETMKEYLSKFGYEVKSQHLTKEEVQEMLEEERKRIEERLKQQYDEKKIETVKEILTEFLRSVGTKLAEIPVEEKRVKLYEKVKQMQEGGEVQSGEQYEAQPGPTAGVQSY
jgi:DNA-binding transcriptional MerR regulator